MKEILVGNRVKLRNNIINHGILMQVTAIENGKARCEYFIGFESVHKVEWYDLADLEICK